MPTIRFTSTLLFSLFCLSEASSAVLESATPNEDQSQAYALYWVHDNINVGGALKAGFLPKSLEVIVDPMTRRPKFGIQYMKTGDKLELAVVTTSFRYKFDKEEVATQVTKTQAQSPNYKTRMPAQIALLQPSQIETKFFSIQDGKLKVYAAEGNSANMSADGTVALSLDLSKFDLKSVQQLLSSKSNAGIMALAMISTPVGLPQTYKEDWSSVAKIVNSEDFLDSQNLGAFIARSTNSDRGILSWLFTEPNNLAEIRLALGQPQLEIIDNKIRFGWLTKRADIQQRLSQLSARSTGSGVRLKIFQDSLSLLASMTFDNICQTYGDQILDLGTGKTGCEGLMK